MNIEVKTITPELAELYLKTNSKNRKLRKLVVDRLASAIINGEWVLTHQGIAFDKNGILLDGQHRLEAIVQAGVSVQMVVSFDVESESFKAIDIGAKRNMADCLKVDKPRIQIATLLARFITTERTASPHRVMHIHNSIHNQVDDLINYCQSTARVFSAAPVKLAAVMRMVESEDNISFIKDSYKNLVTGNVPDLHRSAQSFVGQVTSGRVPYRNTENIFSRAWIVFDYSRKDISKIQIPDNIKYVKECADLYFRHFSRESWMVKGENA